MLAVREERTLCRKRATTSKSRSCSLEKIGGSLLFLLDRGDVSHFFGPRSIPQLCQVKEREKTGGSESRAVGGPRLRGCFFGLLFLLAGRKAGKEDQDESGGRYIWSSDLILR